MQSSRKLFFFLLTVLLLTSFSGSGLIPTAFAEGTRTWEQSKFDELTKGTATGVAIRSVGGLELAPTFKSLYATPSTYIWAIAADDAGNVYVAAGAPARVYRITPDGKATIIFEPKELQVQALQIGPGGALYAATAPDGKVYKLEHKPGAKAQPEALTGTASRSKIKMIDKDKDVAKAGFGSVLEFVSLLRAGHKIYLGPGSRQSRQSLRSYRRSRGNLSCHAQGRAFGLLQER